MPIAAVAPPTFAPSALAHEGHGRSEWFGSVLHYLLEPVHLPFALAVLVVLVMASRWALTCCSRESRVRRP